MNALVLGAGGFIGSHMVSRLASEGFNVVGVDLKIPEYSETNASEFIIGDLTNQEFVESLVAKKEYDEINRVFKSFGNTSIETNEKYLIEGSDIIFDKKKGDYIF